MVGTRALVIANFCNLPIVWQSVEGTANFCSFANIRNVCIFVVRLLSLTKEKIKFCATLAGLRFKTNLMKGTLHCRVLLFIRQPLFYIRFFEADKPA
jgi:hypothetical protein